MQMQNQMQKQMQQQKMDFFPLQSKQGIELQLIKNQIADSKYEFIVNVNENKKQNLILQKKKSTGEIISLSLPVEEFQEQMPSQQTKIQEKQSSNQGLNSQRQDELFPSRLLNKKSNMNFNDQIKFCVESQTNLDQNIQPEKFSVAKTYELVRFCYLFKKQYAIQIFRIAIYTIISMSIFVFALDRNNDKKQFYDSFYSSQQITISKNIDGIFPPLMGDENHLIQTWNVQNFNAPANISDLNIELKVGGILYISSSNSSCMDQIRMNWRVFYHNIQIYEYVPTQFQKIDLQPVTCLGNTQQIISLMKTVSIWTLNWTSYELFLLCQSLIPNTTTRSNSLIILKKDFTKLK